MNESEVEEVRNFQEKEKQLKTAIEGLQDYLEGHLKQLKREEEEQRVANTSKGEERLQVLRQQLAYLTMKNKKIIEDNREKERKERSAIFICETEIETKISKYDQEMTSLQDEYDTLDDEYTFEKRQLNELEERFTTLEEEYLGIMEVRRLEAERIEREEQERMAMLKAVTTIQAFWRSYKVRKGTKGGRGGKKSKK